MGGGGGAESLFLLYRNSLFITQRGWLQRLETKTEHYENIDYRWGNGRMDGCAGGMTRLDSTLALLYHEDANKRDGGVGEGFFFFHARITEL